MKTDLLDLYYLIDAVSSLPGIGKKSAKKIAYFLIKKDEQYLDTFIKRIKNAKNNIALCMYCNNISQNKNHICYICSSETRDRSKLCVVSNVEDLEVIEDTNKYDGLYYVLWGEVNSKSNMNLADLKINKLFNKISENNELKEIIFATNLTADGMNTAKLLHDECKKINQDIVYSRLGFGLPLNASIDYADNITMTYALNNRTQMKK